MLKLILLIFVLNLSPLIYANHHDSVTCLLKKEKVDEHKHLINCIYKWQRKTGNTKFQKNRLSH